MYRYAGLTVIIISLLFVSCSNEKFVPSGIEPTNETDPVHNSGDAADDCAIWINGSDVRIIGTDKQGGIIVYDIDGNETQYLADGPINNIDLRYDFELGGTPTTIVAGNNTIENTIVLYKMDESTLELVEVTDGPIYTSFSEENGLCMYKSQVTGDYYVFVTDRIGQIEQWKLHDAGGGLVGATNVRTLAISSQAEGCVADDDRALLFAAEQSLGIWQFNAEPGTSSKGKLLVNINKNYYLTPQLEGVALFNYNGIDYLVVAVQGNDTFAVFKSTGDFDWAGSFRIVSNKTLGIDKVTHTDGIEIYGGSINPDYPQGILVVQDDENDPDGLNQNFKYVSLQKIIDLLSL